MVLDKYQNLEGPFDEMHWQDNRVKGNDLINRPDKDLQSKIDRKEFKKQKKEYWNEEYDNEKR